MKLNTLNFVHDYTRDLLKKRIVISAGGTGGHLFPAQALAEELTQQIPSVECLFIAGGLQTNRYFDRHNFSFQEIACSPLISKNPFNLCKGGINLLKGFFQCISILKNYHPQIVVGFGSYYTTPVLLAAKWLKIPIILHEANSVPGKANKWLDRFATCVALHFPSTASYFKTKSVLVGLPLRKGYQINTITRETAVAYYGLSSHQPIILICGGSQGAHAINQLIKKWIPLIKDRTWQFIHLTGNKEEIIHLQTIYSSHGISAVVKQFEEKMQFAWQASDAFIGRSGASTIAESIEFEIPGILIPYPHATDHHQEKNADFLVEHVGSAQKLLEETLTAEILNNAIETLFDPKHMQIQKEAIRTYKKRPHQQSLCDLVLQMIQTKGE